MNFVHCQNAKQQISQGKKIVKTYVILRHLQRLESKTKQREHQTIMYFIADEEGRGQP